MADSLFLTGDDVPDYLLGVELMTAGMEWPAMSGPVTITMEHIADAIVAANDDPHIQVPRIKLGHTSTLNGDVPDFDPFAAIGDAEPAFGQFHNLAAKNDGAVLVGDATNILTWLAETAPAAYPNRSSEATWQVAAVDFDVQTPGGKRYSMVVTAVSLLGVYIPAIADLEDLQTLLVSGPAALAAREEPDVPAGQPAAPAALSVSTDVVWTRFNFDWAMAEDNGAEQDTYWWWARDIRLDPNEVIADDEQGSLWSVPFSTDGEDEVTFGSPVQVRQTFVPLAASQRLVASFARPSKPPRQPAAAAAGANAADARPEPEGVTMDESVRDVLAGMGLDPDAASDEQIQAATVLAQAQAETPGDPAPEGDPPAEPDPDDEPADDPAGEPAGDREPAGAAARAAAAPASSLTVAVDRARFEEMEREVSLARQERRANERRQLDAAASAAVLDGRIAPSVREAWRTEIDPGDAPDAASLARAQAAQAALAALPAGRVPLDARASIPGPDADPFPADEPLPANVSLLTPSQRAEMRARRA